MDITKLKELKFFLQELGAAPLKRLSQNFLIDKNIIEKVLDEAKVSEDDLILEIGAGPGALTEAMLNRGAKVIAVEKDTLFAKALLRLQTKDQRLTVFCEDILQFDLDKHLPKNSLKVKVVANLPYHITTPILESIFSHYSRFDTLHIIVQKEMADRMCANHTDKAYSSFSIFLQFHSIPSYIHTIKRRSFYPEPKIESALVSLAIKEKLPLRDSKPFFTVMRFCFTQRRKMITSSLKKLFEKEKIIEALHKNHLNEKVRPEELSLEKWLAFFHTLTTIENS